MEQIKEEIKTCTVEYVNTSLTSCIKYSKKLGCEIPYEWCKKCEFYDEKTKSHKYYKYQTNVKKEYKKDENAEFPSDYYLFTWKCPICGEFVTIINDIPILYSEVGKPSKCNKCNTYFMITKSTYKFEEEPVEFAVSIPKEL